MKRKEFGGNNRKLNKVSDSEDNLLNKVVVIGSDHHNTLGVVRSLGERKVEIYLIIIGSKNSFVSKSRYIKKFWIVNKEKTILSILHDNFNNQNDKPIIITTSDSAATIIDNNFSKLSTKFIVPNINSKQGEIINLMNKQRMNELAIESGLTVPDSWEIRLDNSSYKIPKEIIYPCIVKPLSSLDGVKADIAVCNSSFELKEKLDQMKTNYKKIQVQKYVYGEDSIMLGVTGCVNFHNREVIIPAVIEKVREYPLYAGSTSYAKIVGKSEYIDLEKVHSFLEKTGYVGIFDIDFKFANGKVYFIEINFRNGALGYALTKTGVNIPYLWYLEAAKLNTSEIRKTVKHNFYFMNETSDIRHIINRDIHLCRWIKDLFKTRALLLFNLKDTRPWLTKIFKR